MENKQQKLVLFGAIILALFWLTPTASANRIEKFEFSAPSGFDHAPVIKVYSMDGEKWSKIDDTYITKATANINAKCRYEGKGNKAYAGYFSVSGLKPVGPMDPSENFLPVVNSVSLDLISVWEANIDPVKICNDELKKKVALQPDLSLEEKYRKYPFLTKGFKVKVPSGLKATFLFVCNPIGLGKRAERERNIFLNTVIDCQASALAKDKIPKAKPKPKPKMAKVMILPDLVSNVSYKATPANYVGACPAGINFNGYITATRAGAVKYQYVANDGGESPVFTLKFDKAGTKATGKWHDTISKPDTKSKIVMKGPKTNAPDVSGWWRLKIISPESKHASTAKYTVTCQDKPSRAILRR